METCGCLADFIRTIATSVGTTLYPHMVTQATTKCLSRVRQIAYQGG